MKNYGKSARLFILSISWLLTVSLPATPLLAVDGTIEINHVAALAGIMAGDAAGYRRDPR